MQINGITVKFAEPEDAKHAELIVKLIYESALQRGTGIAKRTPEYIAQKITGGKAVVALHGDRLVGFSYIESWGHGDFVATSGLIVDPEYRHLGLAGAIKTKTFELARLRFPFAKLFSITTSLPVMKLNSRMGYKPVTFSELTDDEEFWQGCQGCKNYDILQRNGRRMCLCTGMLFDPKQPLPADKRANPYMMKVRNTIKRVLHLKK
ncbi:MAG: GNAT family N-acetyltransferase [Muribaculaceae bacterium]|nr:GNAT family N-acetyltransferase [Bacteroides sp.]MDE6058304.1 GNAT family N-acetyltransferase [Muribaculaceae bacterium]MDE6193318.1 GNAT family N-acetyltransferase [Muribaculaceae bacterium]